MKSIDKPERVLKFFRKSGFSDTQIAKIVRRQPSLLLADPEKSLKPKLDVFTSVGASNDTVVNIISKCPGILMRSVENGLVPMFELLKSVMGSDEETLNFLEKYGSLWLASVNTLGANVVVLREMGMPASAIGKFIKSNAYALMAAPERFKSMADRALEMGFDMEKFNFGDAIRAFIAITEDNWKKKVEVFRKWGWSDEDFVSAFKKQPKIMLVSEKKIDGIISCLVDKLGVESSVVARLPYILLYSLENRIIPRCSVIQVLVSECLVEKKDCNFLYYLMIPEQQFFETYMVKHKDILSELMDVYSIKFIGNAVSNAN